MLLGKKKWVCFRSVILNFRSVFLIGSSDILYILQSTELALGQELPWRGRPGWGADQEAGAGVICSRDGHSSPARVRGKATWITPYNLVHSHSSRYLRQPNAVSDLTHPVQYHSVQLYP